MVHNSLKNTYGCWDLSFYHVDSGDLTQVVKCLYLLSHLAALPTLSLYWAVVLWHCTYQANAHPLACIPSPLRRINDSGPLLAGFGVGCLFVWDMDSLCSSG